MIDDAYFVLQASVSLDFRISKASKIVTNTGCSQSVIHLRISLA